MSWEDLLVENDTNMILPWIGGRSLFGRGRYWKIQGRLPEEYGWYRFDASHSRKTRVLEKVEAPFGWEEGCKKTITGYLVGNRLIPDSSIAINERGLKQQSLFVHLIDGGQERFSRVKVVHFEGQYYIYACLEFPLGPEVEVFEAFLERKDSLAGIKNITPALDLAFRFECLIRQEREEHRRRLEEHLRQEEEKRLREEKRQEFMRQVGSGAGRRLLAAVDFDAAARAALLVSGAEFLDARPSSNGADMVVQFRHEHHRFECVVNKETLHVMDSGICLRGNDKLFTLESLPPVISNAIREGVLHVYRNVDNYGDL